MGVNKNHWSFQYLPFKVDDTIFDDNKIVQLDGDSKIPIAGIPNLYEKYENLDGSGYHMKSDDFEPFVDPTGIITNYYDDYGKYLCVLDFDYPEKFDNEVYKNFKYKDTYTRESKNGFHLFYWSDEPRKYVQNKDELKIDFKMVTVANPNSLGGYVRYYPEYSSNDLPVMEIDINEVIRELYESNNISLIEQSSNATNGVSFKVEKDLEVSPYIEAIALYFHYKIRAVNPKWVSGYDYSFKLGLKLSGYIDTITDANALANRLMELSGYSKPYQWIQNFMNGYMTGDEFCRNNFGGKKLTKLAINFYINRNLSLDEYAQKMYKYDFNSFLTVIKNILKN